MTDSDSYTSSETNSLESEMKEDEFEYEISIPETEAKIRLSKESIYEVIEERLKKQLSEKEKEKAWRFFSRHKDFRMMFPGVAMEQGYRMYGASDYDTYCELFKEAVENAIQEAIDQVMSEVWDNIFQQTLDDVTEYIENLDSN